MKKIAVSVNSHLFFVVLFLCLGNYVSGETDMYRFSEDFWGKRESVQELTLASNQLKKEYYKDAKRVVFIYEGAIDLGNYKYLTVELEAEIGKELWWGWKSAKTGDKVYYPCGGDPLIIDGKPHIYTFTLMFPDRNNPIFDVTDALYFEVRDIESESNEVNLKRIGFVPYKEPVARQITIGGVCMDVLWGREVEIDKEIKEESRLLFYTGIYNPNIGPFRRKSKREEWVSDGARFKILIEDKLTLKREEIFQMDMRPLEREEERQWKRMEIDISRYSNKTVKFIFQVDPLKNSIGDYVVWGNPMLINHTREEMKSNIPIFIISCDTLRPDHLLPYGYHLPTSPRLDAFAKDAVVFENSYTTQTFTPVAHMSLLTGKFPENHGMTKNIDLRSDVITVQEMLQKNGYLTAGFTGFLWWFIPSRGFSRGMDYFSVPDMEKGGAQDRRSVFEVHEEAKEWIKKSKSKNLFVFLHNYDVHSTAYNDLLYDAEDEEYKVFSRGMEKPNIIYPENCQDIPAGTLFLRYSINGDIIPTEEQIEYNRALYDDCVYKVDCALGDFFDFLKKENLYNSAFIAIVSDHGESLWEHELYGHENVYEESMRCVMMIKFPNQKYAGQRVRGKVILEDIVPTILSLVNEQEGPPTDGLSLISLLEGDGKIREYVFSSDSGIDMKAIVKGDYKFLEDIKRSKRNLFDLTQPMAEYKNIISREPKIAREMEHLLMKQFGLKEEGWWLCFQNADSFFAGNIKIRSTVPILNIKTQSCVFRPQNDRFAPTELVGSIFIPSNLGTEKSAILQIIPSQNEHELFIYLQRNVDWIYPSEYQVIQDEKEIVFYFSSNYKGTKTKSDMLNDLKSEQVYFWVLHYPTKGKEEYLRKDIPEEVRETLENLGYLN